MPRASTIPILALVAATTAMARTASAAGFRFAWTAPVGCPERGAVLDRVGELVGRAPSTDEDLWFEADVTPTDNGRWRAVLRSGWPGSTTERHFESASCASVASATAFIIAMSLDPAGVAERATENVQRARESPPEPRSEREPLAPTDRGSGLHVSFGPRTTGDVGSLPKASLGAGASLALEHAAWLVAASGQAWLPRTTSSSATGAGGEIGLLTGELRGCAAVFKGSARTDVCLGGEAGASDGVGTGIPKPMRARGLWLAALGGVTLRPTTAGLLGAWVGVDVGVPLTIPTYFIEGLGEVHKPWPVFARATMGMEIRVF